MKNFKQKIQIGDYLLLAGLVLFLVYKLANLTFRFGDGDAYFYMLQNFWHGHWPYRDFFLADPPGFLLFLSVLRPMLGTHWLGYQALPIFLESINAVILYVLLRPKLKLAWLAVPVYLFSFTILSTSDFSTGVQLTVMFSLLAWLFWDKDHPYASGVFWAFSILTKPYALPAIVGLAVYGIWKKQRWIPVVLSALVTGLIILLPFFLVSPHGFINSIILHQLHRTAGNDKWVVWLFFLKKEWILVLLGLAGGVLKANRRYLVSFGLTVIFFLLFKDLYYLYLAYFFPFLIIFTVTLLDKTWQDREIRVLAIFGLLLLGWSMFGGFLAYQSSSFVQGRFLNAGKIAVYLKTQTAHSEIYGSHEITPLLALISGKTIFGNYIDTNTQVFAAQTLDLEKVSRDAAARGVYLVARITDFPDYGIKDQGYQGYFSPTVFAQACQRLKFFNSTSQESDNYIGIYDCHY